MRFAYHYSAKNARGALVDGMVFCSCYDDAVFLVKNALRLDPIELRLDPADSLLRLIRRREPIRDRIRLYRTLAERKRLGRSIPSGIADAIEYVDDKELVSSLTVMRQAMLDGEKFSAAMERAGFPATDVHAIRAVEGAGKEGETLAALADHMEMREELRRRMASIVWYPLLVLAAMWVAAWGMTLFVAPKLGEFFGRLAALNLELPAYARIYYELASILRTHWFVASVLWFALPIATIALARSRRVTEVAADRLRALHQLSMKSDLVTSFSALALLMSAGVKPVEAFAAVSRAARRTDNQERFAEMAGIYRAGNFSIARAVQLCAFPRYVIAEISAGESAQTPTEGMRKLVSLMRQDLGMHMEQVERLAVVVSNALIALFLLGFVFITIYPQISATMSRL